MEIVYLIVLIVVIALKTWLLESQEDYYMISDSKGLFKKQWKFWGNANEMASMLIPIALLTIFVAWKCIFIFPILWLVFWINHDMAMGWRLGEDIGYIGDKGFDGKMKAMFLGSGWLFLAVRTCILAGMIAIYCAL
jgi:hypothetical protein